jgi:hypothetical protein
VFIVLSVKHAGDEALGNLEGLLVQLREIIGLKEKRPGIFYHRSKAFLHFHEDPPGASPIFDATAYFRALK